MSYHVSVPVINQHVWRQGKEALLEQLRALDAKRVLLAIGCYDTMEREAILADLKENCAYFHEQGLEVGTWIWAFMFEKPNDFTKMSYVKPTEQTSTCDACPLDESFLRYSGEYLQDLARCGVDLILFDDDLRFGFRPNDSMGCICELHRKRIERLAAHNLRPRLRQEALRLVGILDEEVVGDDALQHSVTQKLQPLIVDALATLHLHRCGAVHEGEFVELDVVGRGAENLAKGAIVFLICAPQAIVYA